MRAANRMSMRQSYRTASRMQRRRSYAQNKMGMRQDFEPAGEEEYYEDAGPAPAAPAAPEQPAYLAELEQLAALRDQGVISTEEFDAKKKALLGI